MVDSKITDLDLYGMLGLEISATTSEVRRAYRQKALKCHPDKNPDNPKAAELFQQLTRALEVLLDESARAAYDNLLKAKAEAKQRHSVLDERRKRFKEDLEAREKAASSFSNISPEDKLKQEIERLRKEGAKLVQEEIKLLQKEVLKDLHEAPDKDLSLCQLKVTWKTAKASQYNENTLRKIFSKYGSVVAIVVTDKKAVVELDDPQAAELAIKIEVGFGDNPFKVTYASSKVRKANKNRGVSNVTASDAESLADRTHRQAAERRRLIEQLMRDDAED